MEINKMINIKEAIKKYEGIDLNYFEEDLFEVIIKSRRTKKCAKFNITELMFDDSVNKEMFFGNELVNCINEVRKK